MAEATVIGACGRALLSWIILYVVLLHTFVYYNWNATDGSYPDGSPLAMVVKQDPTTPFPQKTKQNESTNDDDSDNATDICLPNEENLNETSVVLEEQDEDDLLPTWIALMDEEELALLLAEEPLEALSLVELDDSTSLPEPVQPIPDRRDELQTSIAQIQALLQQQQEEMEWLQQQLPKLQAVTEKAEQIVHRHQQQLLLAEREEEAGQVILDDESKTTIWQRVRVKTQQWQSELGGDDNESLHNRNRFFAKVFQQQQEEEDESSFRPSVAAELWSQELRRITDWSLQLETREQVNEFVESLLETLDHQVQNAPHISWRQLTQALRLNDSPSKTASPIACPKQLEICDQQHRLLEEEKQKVAVIPEENAAAPLTEQDVLDKLDEIRSLIHQSHDVEQLRQQKNDKGTAWFPVVLPESQERLSNFFGESKEWWMGEATFEIRESWVHQVQEVERQQNEELEQDEDGENDADGNCVTTEDVHALWHAGLVAVERQQDLNRALLTTLAQQGVDTSHVILDAILPESQSALDRMLADHHGDFIEHARVSGVPAVWDGEMPFTWRQVLDRPWTKTVTKSWLPWLIDAIGGYNDALDEWLDQTIPSSLTKTMGDGQERVVDETGEILYEQVLKLAGQYPLPRVVLEQWLATVTKSKNVLYQ
ncbi:hypothetical protein ACA910_002932 [Epithemia clementina (nom. ined.)]